MTLAGRVYTVGDLGAVNVSARNGASVQLTVGNVRRDPVDPGNRGQGHVVLGAADATISARTGDVAQIEIGGARSSISADARSASGFNVGSFFSATESLIVDLTVAQYTTAEPNTSAVVQGNALGTVRLHGDRPRGVCSSSRTTTRPCRSERCLATSRSTGTRSRRGWTRSVSAVSGATSRSRRIAASPTPTPLPGPLSARSAGP